MVHDFQSPISKPPKAPPEPRDAGTHPLSAHRLDLPDARGSHSRMNENSSCPDILVSFDPISFEIRSSTGCALAA